jgi:hypothetical protein
MPDPQQSAQQSTYVAMPDGSYVEWPAGVTAEEFKAKTAHLATPTTPPAAADWRDAPSTPTLHKMPRSIGDVGKEAGRSLANIGSGFFGAIAHPLDTIGGIAKTGLDAAQSNLPALASDFQPMVQSLMTHPLETVENGIGGGIATAGAGEGLGSLAAKVPNLSQVFRPTSSPDIVPPGEMAARNLAKAIGIEPARTPSFIKAAPLEVPNALKYAQETGNPLKTRLEFVKALKGTADQPYSQYMNEILTPNDKLVDTTGTGFGEKTGEGPRTAAKLSDINNRVIAINKELGPANKGLNAQDVRSKLAGEADILREHDLLTDILHKNLAQATGLQPEDIANLRQRAGRAGEMANSTDAAVTGGMQAEGNVPSRPPLKFSEIPSKVWEGLQGGRSAIADRAFQRAIKGFPGEAQPLPQITMQPQAVPAPSRRPIWAQSGIEPGQPPVEPFVSSPEAAQNLTKALQGKRAALNARDQALQDEMNRQNEPIRQIRAANLRRKIESVYRQEQ